MQFDCEQHSYFLGNVHDPGPPASWTPLDMSTPGKIRPRNNPCIWGQVAQSSEIVQVPEAMLGLCGSLSGGVSSHQTESVCCTLWGGEKIEVWRFIHGKAVKVQKFPTLIQFHPLIQVNSALGCRKVSAFSALCHHFHNELSSLNL